MLLCCTALAQAPSEPTAAPRSPPPGYGDAYAGKKKVLVIGDLHTGNQNAHDALSHAIATIEQLGRSSGAYVAFLRTDTQWVTKDEVWGMGDYAKGGSRQARGRSCLMCVMRARALWPSIRPTFRIRHGRTMRA